MAEKRRRDVADDWAGVGVIQEIVNRHRDAQGVAATHARTGRALRRSGSENAGSAATIRPATARSTANRLRCLLRVNEYALSSLLHSLYRERRAVHEQASGRHRWPRSA